MREVDEKLKFSLEWPNSLKLIMNDLVWGVE